MSVRDGRARELAGSGMAVAMSAQFAVVVVCGRIVQDGGAPYVMLAIRFGVQSLVLLGALLVLGRPLVPACGERLALALAGGVGYALESALAFLAMNHGKAGPVVLMFYTYPVMVMLATIALDRRAPQRTAVLALALAIAGAAVVVLVGGGLEIQPLGIALALCSAAVFSSYLLVVDRRVRRTDALTSATWLGAWAAAGNVALAVTTGSISMPAAEHAVALGVMAVASAGAFAAMFGALRRVGPIRTSIIGVLEPVAIAVLAAFVLSQPLVPPTALGGLLIVTGAVVATLVRAPHTPEPTV